MAVKTNITINIVEPGSDVPVPDTGLFTHGIGGTEASIIATVGIVIIIAIAAIILYLRKKKINLKPSKHTSIILSILAIITSIATFTGLTLNSIYSHTNAKEGDLTVTAEDTNLTIEVGNQPVFAVLPVQVTVEEATKAGYTLTAYTDNTDLVSTTNPNNKIPMVTVEGDELTSLQDNTWGLALDNEPTAKDNKVYTALSTDQDNTTIIKTIDDYLETPANDTTTIYYGFYITPNIPVGTYTGGEVEYEAKENKVATVTFDGNGLYFNNDPNQTQNIVKYLPGAIGETKYSHTINVDDSGNRGSDMYEYPLNMDETFTYTFEDAENIYVKIRQSISDSCNPVDPEDYFSFWSGNHPEYTAKNDYRTAINAFGNMDGKYLFNNYTDYGRKILGTSIESNSLTFAYTTGNSRNGYCGTPGYGYYAELIGYTENRAVYNWYEVPSTESSEGYRFLGWNTDPNAGFVIYDPENQDYLKQDVFLNPNIFMPNTDDNMILYAIWTPAPFNIAYDGNGATTGSMQSTNNNNITTTLEHQNIILSDVVDLYAPNYKKDGYGFVGWSVDKDAWSHLANDDLFDDPIIYGPNQTITVDKYIVNALDKGNNTVTLYAIWAPAEKDSQGNPVYLQNWTGCNTLTPTTYDNNTNMLIVGNNTVTALMDNRDNNIYTVARLADGNCWMIENLRLDNTAIITEENTDNPYMIDGVVAIKNNDGGTSNHLSPNSNSWCRDTNANCNNKSYLNTDNTNLDGDGMIVSYDGGDFMTGKDYQWYSYGNNYNWYSATAGHGIYETENNTNVQGSICPASWTLPYGGDDGKGGNINGNVSGGFYYLNQQMGGDTSSIGSNNWRSFPNNFINSGNFWTYTSAYARGVQGYYWSSSSFRSSKDYAYTFLIDNSGVRPGNDIGRGEKYWGLSVRCVLIISN